MLPWNHEPGSTSEHLHPGINRFSRLDYWAAWSCRLLSALQARVGWRRARRGSPRPGASAATFPPRKGRPGPLCSGRAFTDLLALTAPTLCGKVGLLGDRCGLTGPACGS